MQTSMLNMTFCVSATIRITLSFLWQRTMQLREGDSGHKGRKGTCFCAADDENR